MSNPKKWSDLDTDWKIFMIFLILGVASICFVMAGMFVSILSGCR